MEQIITIWQRYNKQDDGPYEWEHNHVCDGYDENQTEPQPSGDIQKKSWKGGKWRSFKGYLIDQKVHEAD